MIMIHQIQKKGDPMSQKCLSCGNILEDNVVICSKCKSTNLQKINPNDFIYSAKYEYIVDSIQDNSNGSISPSQVQSLLTHYAQGGWRLHSVFRNELGRNSRQIGVGGFSGGANATMEQTILIFERCIKPEE